jgi:hypothetical protein
MMKGFACFEMSFRLMSHSAEGKGGWGLCVHVTVREMFAMEIDLWLNLFCCS